ncbi:MAG: homoserine O-succinyltransferase [Pseudomonadota bacterium]
MPLVAHTDLPTFERLRAEGMTIIDRERARHQDIRELHVGLLNMMPDAALAATERQFFRLVGEANQIVQLYVHPFSLPALPRSREAQARIDRYYESFETIREEGLDALIITGANVIHSDLSQEVFWQPLTEVFHWAYENVASTLCSCLATHAVLQFRYGQRRRPLGFKRWGVFSHRVAARTHPLVNDINTRFDVPHSRFNDISREQFEAAGLPVLVESAEAGVHLAVSPDGFRIVYFQGHPEYDTISLLKEYKREVNRFGNGQRGYPPFPEHTIPRQQRAILEEYREQLMAARVAGHPLPKFPEHWVEPCLDNTWHDTAEAVINNWIGLVYQVTSMDRRQPFMADVNPNDPLGWCAL